MSIRKTIIGVLVALVPSIVFAWELGESKDRDYHFAVTVNDSDGVLGQFCYVDAGQCYWLVAISTACDKDRSNPVLASGSSGAFHINLICRGPITLGGRQYYRYFLDDFDKIDAAVRAGGRVGIAIPLESGSFRVVRFDATEAGPVIDQMRSIAEKAMRSPQRKASTKDSLI